MILTGKRANQGNHKKWREYAEGTARELNMAHITNRLDRVKNVSATEAAPIDLFSSDSDEDAGLGNDEEDDAGALAVPSSATAISLFTLAKDIEEMHHVVRHVLCVYAREEAGGYSVDQDGIKMFEKLEAPPELAEEERIVQYSAIRVVAISLLGKSKVGAWPDAGSLARGSPRAGGKGAPGGGGRRSPSLTARSMPEFLCNVCKELMYEPVTTNCGHNFCRSCLVSWMERKKKFNCPTCRNKISHNWRMPTNKVVWNAMQTMFPEALKTRKVAHDIEEAARVRRSKKRKKVDSEETVRCSRCRTEVLVKRMGVHLKLCSEESGGARGRRREDVSVAVSRSGRKRPRVAVPSSDEDESDDGGEGGGGNADGKPSASAQEGRGEGVGGAAPAASAEGINREERGITVMSNSEGRQIGAIDPSAVFHMRAGLDHLASMEIQRLRALRKPLREFHPGVLKHMRALHEAKIRRGEVEAGDMTLLPKLEVFGRGAVLAEPTPPAAAVGKKKEEEGEEEQDGGSWGSSCLVQ